MTRLALTFLLLMTACSPTKPAENGAPTDGSAKSSGDPAPTNSATPSTAKPSGEEVKLVGAADVGRGKKLYEEEHCGGCHGTKEKPSSKFPNLFKIDWDDEEIAEAFETIKNGDSPMPAYGDKLDAKAIADIVAFLRSEG
jgi:mono/diheme cytochrome c family protein